MLSIPATGGEEETRQRSSTSFITIILKRVVAQSRVAARVRESNGVSRPAIAQEREREKERCFLLRPRVSSRTTARTRSINDS